MNKIKCKICGWIFKNNKAREYQTREGTKIDCIRCCAEHETKQV